jgi:hypothetical protein
VKAAPGQDPMALRKQIRQTLANPELVVQTKTEATDSASRKAKALLDILYALLSVSVLVGALGVVNTSGRRGSVGGAAGATGRVRPTVSSPPLADRHDPVGA